MVRDDELHTMDPRTRFSSRAADYARSRPDYPQALFDALFEHLPAAHGLRVVDLGAGTGIASRQLADRGVRVVAVEPNREMRAAALPHPGVEWCDGSAEETGLAADSTDLVTSFQAFHWFDPVRALAESRRILVAGGHLALVWNRRDESDPFTRDYSRLVREISARHPAERRAVLDHIPLAESGFEPILDELFPHRQVMDLDGLLGRVASASYMPAEESGRSQTVELMTELFRRWCDHQGRVRLAYQSSLRLARVES